MKTSSFKIGTLGLALSAFLTLTTGFAEDISTFEKLLQDAIKVNQNTPAVETKSNTEKSRSASSSSAKAKPAIVPSSAFTAPVSEKSKTADEVQDFWSQPALNAAPAKESAAPAVTAAPKKGNVKLNDKMGRAAEVISDGWSTILPNAPGTVVPVEPKVAKQTETVTPPVKQPVAAEPQPAVKKKAVAEETEEPAAKADEAGTEELQEPKTIHSKKAAKTSSKAEESEVTESETEETAVEENTGEGEEIEVTETEEEETEAEADETKTEGAGTASTRQKTETAETDEEATVVEPKKVNKSAPSKTATKNTDKSDLSSKLDELEKEPVVDETAETAMPAPTAAPEKTEVMVSIPDFDNEDDETVWKMINPDLVGDPHGKDKIKLMYDEIVNGLRTRNVTVRYDMWKSYAKSTLRGTAGINTGSELDGRCRLSWYQQLYAEPIQSVFEAEEYARQLHVGLLGGHRHLAELMPGIRKRMDIPERTAPAVNFPTCTTPLEALAEVKRCLFAAQAAHAKAFSTLSPAELSELEKNFVETFVGKGCVNGHTIPARSVGRRHMDILEKADKSALYDAAEAMIPLTNPSLLALLEQLPEDALPQVMLNGQKVQRLTTAAGDIIISGRENNVYDLDSPTMRDVICIIDLGGNDIYREGTCNYWERPVLAIIDLHGDDAYTGSKPGIQGSSIMGVSFLLDAEGNDTYTAVDVAQGSTMGGIGLLIDCNGSDKYKALRRVQGHALAGLGMLIDKGEGNDDFHAALWAQGFGAPGGFGVIEDGAGNNHYYCGGLYLDSYPEHPGYDGWAQGVGAGIRQVANGGIGILLSGEGDDVYEVDYFGHGGGYWLGVGIARDFGGNDIRHGTTKTAYNGSPRREREWTRFANGFGCHYSLGYCFDDGGNDTYGGMIMGTGMAWDLSIGFLCDFNGSDKFTATGGMTQGVGAEGSIGILFSYGGDDQYASRNQGYANSNITYHSPSNCGGNISFLINYGGNDKYGCGASNNSYVQRGAIGGFLIDRPTEKEAADDLVALRQLIETRNREIAEYDAAVALAKEEAALQKKRYVPPRQRRPQPVSAEQQQRLGAVPSFDTSIPRTGSVETQVK